MELRLEPLEVQIQETTGKRSIEDDFVFPTNVKKVEVALKGFKLDQRPDQAHHQPLQPLDIVHIQASIVRFTNNIVRYRVTTEYPGKPSMKYTGHVDLLFIANIESPPTGSPPPGSTPPGSTPPGSTPPGSTPPGSTPPGSTPPGSTPPG